MMADNDSAIVIGISRYPALKELQGPVQDAEDFVAWLGKNAQVDSTRIYKVLSDTPPKPGDRPIQQEVDDAFAAAFDDAKKTNPRRLYVYFAGHGCAMHSRHLALVMANASMEYLNYALDAPSYHEGLLRRAPFPEQLIFYDCCRNYDRRVVGRRAPWSDSDPSPYSDSVYQFILYGAAFAQYANERAIEYSERRGLFTKALLEGLGGWAAVLDGNSWVVSTHSLASYVRARLAGLAADFGLRQNLVRESTLEDDVVLAPVEPQRKLVTITVGREFGEVIIRDKSLKEVTKAAITRGKATAELPCGWYELSVAGHAIRRHLDLQYDTASVVDLVG